MSPNFPTHGKSRTCHQSQSELAFFWPIHDFFRFARKAFIVAHVARLQQTLVLGVLLSGPTKRWLCSTPVEGASPASATRGSGRVKLTSQPRRPRTRRDTAQGAADLRNKKQKTLANGPKGRVSKPPPHPGAGGKPILSLSGGWAFTSSASVAWIARWLTLLSIHTSKQASTWLVFYTSVCVCVTFIRSGSLCET